MGVSSGGKVYSESVVLIYLKCLGSEGILYWDTRGSPSDSYVKIDLRRRALSGYLRMRLRNLGRSGGEPLLRSESLEAEYSSPLLASDFGSTSLRSETALWYDTPL